jgi:ferredoxin-type protein NapG
MRKSDAARREFLTGVGEGAALVATGGLLWSYLLRQQARANHNALRPPGSGRGGLQCQMHQVRAVRTRASL